MFKKFSSQPALLAMVFLGALFMQPAGAANFLGSNIGPIPDNDAAGREVYFAVSGMNGISDVKVTMYLDHTLTRDLDVELIAPNGIARRKIFSRNYYFGNGDVKGYYSFDDQAKSDWWLAAYSGSNATIPPGAYRTSTADNSLLSGIKTGGCITPLTFAFNQLNANQITGTWTLRVRDLDNFGYHGSINYAALTLNDGLFASTFDAPMRGSCKSAQFDYTGSNRSSYVLIRSDANGIKTWIVKDNDGSDGLGFMRTYVLGVPGDIPVGGDFDGDGIWDPAVWTPGNPGHYKIIASSHPQLPIEFDFGKIGDKPGNSGDYDGDGITDVAHFDAAAERINIRLSTDGFPGSIPLPGIDYAAGGLDINGDGIADVAGQIESGGPNSYVFTSGTDGSVLNALSFGSGLPYIILGNYSGQDAMADLTLSSLGVPGTDISWTTIDSATWNVQSAVVFGKNAVSPGLTFLLSGDFDGDGMDDYSIWNSDSDPVKNGFYSRPSSDPSNPVFLNIGQIGDYPVEATRTH